MSIIFISTTCSICINLFSCQYTYAFEAKNAKNFGAFQAENRARKSASWASIKKVLIEAPFFEISSLLHMFLKLYEHT